MKLSALLRLFPMSIVFSLPAIAAHPVEMDQVYLYLPDTVMKDRIANDDEYLRYAVDVRETIMDLLSQYEIVEPATFGIIVTLRAPFESKVWLDFDSGGLPDSISEALIREIETITPPELTHGIVPIAFCMRVGGSTESVNDVPLHPSWLPFADGQIEVTELIARAWK